MQIVYFLVILTLVILIHELGHYLTAKLFRVRVEEFGIGFPPRLTKLFVWKETLFSLNWLPIGGFVKLLGEDYQEEIPAGPDVFWSKPLWQRGIVLVAGVVMNFLLGALMFAIVYSVMGIPTKTDRVRVVGLAESGPAALAGIKENDVVVKLGETEIKSNNEFIDYVDQYKGNEVELTVKRGEEEKTFKILVRENPPEGEGSMGVVLSEVELVKLVWWQMPFKGVMIGLQEAWAWGSQIARGVGVMFMDIFAGKGVSEDVAGPVGIYQVSTQVLQTGGLAVFHFIGVLSINLAILNILPLPALDGGRIVFLGVELLIGQKLKNKIEGWVHGIGMVFLMSLLVLVTIRDVMRLW